MASYEQTKEFEKLSTEIKNSVLHTAAVEAGAATVGALVAAHALDVTGMCVCVCVCECDSKSTLFSPHSFYSWSITPTHTHTHTGGLLTASTLALLGLVVLPYRRNAQRQEFRTRVGTLRTQMDNALTVRLDRELNKVCTDTHTRARRGYLCVCVCA